MEKRKETLFILIGIYVLLIICLCVSSAYAELVHNIMFLMVISQALNIVFGFAGLVNLGQVAFIGIGAYVFAVSVCGGLNPYISMILGGLSAVLSALLLGVVVLRFKGGLFALGTIILTSATPYLITGTGIAGGYYGITLYKYVGSMYNAYLLVGILIVVSVIITILTLNMTRSPFGYSLKALREDHDAALTAGINTFRSKLIAFCLSAIFPGIAGGVLAFKTFWVTPSGSFNMLWNIEAILAVLLGGRGSVIGPIVGALIYQLLKDLLMRIAPGFQVLIFGFLVIVMVLFAPEGVVGFLRDKVKRLRNVLV
ncbi:MAG: branched-chain amino acid ABC transporter permease [Candidatus Bathyarchaeia archaeon]